MDKLIKHYAKNNCRNSMPILNYSLVKEGKIYMSDLDVTINIDVDIDRGVCLLIDNNKLKNINFSDIKFIDNKAYYNNILISSDNLEEMPTLPSVDCEGKDFLGIITYKELKELECYFKDNKKDASCYNLMGYCVDTANNRIACTDGARIGFIDFVSEAKFENLLVMPTFKFLDTKSKSVRLYYKDGFFVLRESNYCIFLRQVDGDFPKYSQVLTNKIDYTVKLKLDKQSINTIDTHFNMLKSEYLAKDKYKAIIFKDNYLYIKNITAFTSIDNKDNDNNNLIPLNIFFESDSNFKEFAMQWHFLKDIIISNNYKEITLNKYQDVIHGKTDDLNFLVMALRNY